MAKAPKRAVLPQINQPWIDKDGYPTQPFRNFMLALAANNFGPLVGAADDTAAARAGVPLDTLYEDSGAVRIRKA